MEDSQKILATLKRMEDEIHTIKRGVYGDEPNGVKGLIQTDKEQHTRIKKLENGRNKFLWFGGGVLAVIEIIIQLIKLQ